MQLYLGIRRNGALVAMAGERLRPPGWTEISAIRLCEATGFRLRQPIVFHAVRAPVGEGVTPAH